MRCLISFFLSLTTAAALAAGTSCRLLETDSLGAPLADQPVTRLMLPDSLVVGDEVRLVSSHQYVCLWHPCDPYDVTTSFVVDYVALGKVSAHAHGASGMLDLRYFDNRWHVELSSANPTRYFECHSDTQPLSAKDRDQEFTEILIAAGVPSQAAVEGERYVASEVSCRVAQCTLRDRDGHERTVSGTSAERLGAILRQATGEPRAAEADCYTGYDWHVEGVVYRCAVR